MEVEGREHVAASDHTDQSGASDNESEPEAPADLMVKTRARRSNAGNRMATLLAKSAEEEEEEWGEEWEDAPNEEDFQGGDVNEQEDYNMDSSSSEEGDDGDDDDDAGERELRKAERREKNKKRKAVTNPFTARVAGVARKKVRLDVPPAQSPVDTPPRPKKKSERASWLPTEEDGPVRASARQQTVANKEATLSKLLEKDKRRDDTLAMMKAAEARKKKDEPKPLTQAERLAEAARNERVNKKTLHRWEEAEEARAAERQAKIDAFKNRQIDGPFIRFYSGPGIFVDGKIKYTGKEAPTIEHLEEKLNKEPSPPDSQAVRETTQGDAVGEGGPEQPSQPTPDIASHANSSLDDHAQPSQDPPSYFQTSMSVSHMPSLPTSLPQLDQTPQLPWTAASQAAGGDVFMGSHGMSFSNNHTFAPLSQDSFLSGIDQYAQTQRSQNTPSDLPPNPFTQASPYNSTYTTAQSQFPQQSLHVLNDPILTQHGGAIGPQALLQQFQRPLAPPAPPRRKAIKRGLRNLLILSSFPNLDLPPSSTRLKTAASLSKDKDRAALIQLSCTLFNWSLTDATTFVNTILSNNHTKPLGKKALAEREAALKPVKPLCAVTNAVARYRDPETGIAYRDARAFGVLRGVVGGGFVWSGDLGCYVGGRAKPLESMGGKGFLGMPPAKGVPRRFLEMPKKVMAPPVQTAAPVEVVPQTSAAGESPAASTVMEGDSAMVKSEYVVAT
ncbi:YL1-domain-containing protein [Ophiobolus disseminans]|uniref:YL1-domain-containing protein n=1 Tax=Ophiobolus disseminans TaxID=1469910 RepID=A0A6A6ZE08_9PLEO|nr:YL1-domain-containing protein [Ophiobolus disseminans]